jgi:uncharacterized heparinase superfamily protein
MADRGIAQRVVQFQFLEWPSAWLSRSARPIATGFAQELIRLEQSDTDRAFLMYAGHFEWFDESYQATPADLFCLKATPKWQAELQHLTWLKDFAASKRSLHSYFAFQMLQHWSKAKISKPDYALIVRNLSFDGAALFRNSEPKIKSEFFAMVSSHVQKLLSQTPRTSQAALDKSLALMAATIAFQGFDGLRKIANDLFVTHVDELINPDGGPVSRQVSDIAKLLAELLPLRSALKLQKQSLPQAAHQAISRMLPFLAMLQRGDGGIAQFGNSPVDLATIQALRAQDDQFGECPNLASQSGYARLAKGKTCVLADVQSNFEIEFSEGSLCLLSCASFCNSPIVHTELQDLAQGQVLYIAKADGRERNMFLASDGKDLRVEDYSTMPAEIILKINPSVKVSSLREGAGLMLVTPAQNVWQLSLRGGEIIVQNNGAVVRLVSTDATLKWALKKQDKPFKYSPRKPNKMPDLLA